MGRRRGRTALLLAPVAIAAVPLLAVAALAGWALAERSADPMAIVRLPPPALTILADETDAGGGDTGDRLYRDIMFVAADGAPIPVTVSLPRAHDGTPLPVFAILGGLTGGKRALAQVPDPGPNILVSIGYPADAAAIEDGTWPQRVAAARAAALRTPPAVAAVAQWLHAQPWADDKRISLLGYSLGAMAAPAAHHMAARHGAPFRATILAFGGAGLEAVLAGLLADELGVLARPAAWFAASLGRATDPALHLPHMAGDLLVISAVDDALIRPEATARLHGLVPAAARIEWLDGGHIDPDKRAVMRRVVDLSATWLIETGAANPPR